MLYHFIPLYLEEFRKWVGTLLKAKRAVEAGKLNQAELRNLEELYQTRISGASLYAAPLLKPMLYPNSLEPTSSEKDDFMKKSRTTPEADIASMLGEEGVGRGETGNAVLDTSSLELDQVVMRVTSYRKDDSTIDVGKQFVPETNGYAPRL